MQKKTDAELNEVHSLIKNDNELLRGTQFNGATLKSFIFYQIKKVRDGNDASKHKGEMEGQEFRRISGLR